MVNLVEILGKVPQAWALEGRCTTEANTINFFPNHGWLERCEAVKFCQSCPVRQECEDYATHPDSFQEYGIWGGTTAKSRGTIVLPKLEAFSDEWMVSRREALGLTASEAGRRSNTHRQSIHRYENGIIKVSPERTRYGLWLREQTE